MAHTGSAAHLVALGQRGRLVLPAELRKSLGLRAGDQLVVEMDEHSIRLTPRTLLAQRDRGAFVQFTQRGRSLVDELLEERRAEAARDLDA